jgi:hypothetical protein
LPGIAPNINCSASGVGFNESLIISPFLSTAQHPPEQMLINLSSVSSDALLNLFRVQSFFMIEEPDKRSRRLYDSSGYWRQSLRLTA